MSFPSSEELTVNPGPFTVSFPHQVSFFFSPEHLLKYAGLESFVRVCLSVFLYVCTSDNLPVNC